MGFEQRAADEGAGWGESDEAAEFEFLSGEAVEPLWQAIKEWTPDETPGLDWRNQPRPRDFDQHPAWRALEVPPGGGRILVFDS